jgi:hypothetical protein
MELELEYQKVETNWKLLELAVTMDTHELIITMKQIKRLKKENVDLNVKRVPRQNFWGILLKPLSVYNSISKSCSAMFPSFRNNWRTCNSKFGYSPGRLRRQDIHSTRWPSWRGSKSKMRSWKQNSSFISLRSRIIRMTMGVLQNADYQNYKWGLVQLLKIQGTIEISISYLCPSFPWFFFASFCCPLSSKDVIQN